MSRRGFLEQSPWAASCSGDRAARQKQSSSQVLPGTLPVSEPWSQPQARSFSEDNTASPAHLAPQDLLSPGPRRVISAAPPKQTFTPGYTNSSPSTLAKHQLPGKEPHGATGNSSVHPSCSERDACAQRCQPQQAPGCRSPSLCAPHSLPTWARDPGHNFTSKTWNTLRTRPALAPWVRLGKSRKQRHKHRQLQLETQLHPNSKALFAAALSHRSFGCAWRNVTYSRLGTSAAQGGEATANWQL